MHFLDALAFLNRKLFLQEDLLRGLTLVAYYAMKDYRLHDVLASINSGRLQLPEFQRNYVWRLNEQKALLDSIQKGYPVGAILLLEIDSVNGSAVSPFGKRLFNGAPEAKEPIKELVLDGQQRLTTCFLTFSGNSDKWFFIDLRKLFAETKGEAGRQIDLSEYLESRKRPPHPESLLFDKDLLPLPFITEDRNDLREKLNSYANNLADLPSEHKYVEFIKVTLHGYLDSFYDYKFPAIVLPAKLDLEAVANVFTKLNTSGMKLSAFDLCVSKLFPERVNLRSMWSEIKDDPDISLLDSDGTAVLQTIALLDNKTPKKAALVKVMTKTAVQAYWEKSVEALRETSRLFSASGSRTKSTVPYDTIAPSLAAAITLAKEAKALPDKASRQQKVNRWIVQSAFLQRYTEGTDAKKPEDVMMAVEWFDSNIAPQFLEEKVVWQPSSNGSKSSGARYAAFLAILNAKTPTDFVIDQKIGLEIPGIEPAQIHHIFPRAFLKSRGKNEEPNLMLNMTFLSGPSNNFISDNAPSVYISNLLKRFLEDGLSKEVARQKLIDRLSGHLISEQGLEALLADDYDSFVDSRATELLKHLETLGIPVSRVADDVLDGDEYSIDEEIVED